MNAIISFLVDKFGFSAVKSAIYISLSMVYASVVILSFLFVLGLFSTLYDQISQLIVIFTDIQTYNDNNNDLSSCTIESILNFATCLGIVKGFNDSYTVFLTSVLFLIMVNFYLLMLKFKKIILELMREAIKLI